MGKKSLRIYNFFPLLFGKIKDWKNHINSIKEMGFNSIYINPFFETGYSNSLYSIKDNFKFDSRFSDDFEQDKQELKKFISICHEKNIIVIWDIVINHVAIDSELIKKEPAWFEYEDGKVKSPGVWIKNHYKKWNDLAQVKSYPCNDYHYIKRHWFKVIDFYLEFNIDGIRCDLAYLVHENMWKDIIKYVKSKKKEMLFIAETLGCSNEQLIKTANLGFDYVLNSIKWWNLEDDWFLDQYYNFYKNIDNFASIGFCESHDTQRIANKTNLDEKKIKMLFTLSALFSTGYAVPAGFEYLNDIDLHVKHTETEDLEMQNSNISDFIKHINKIKRLYKIFTEDNIIEIVGNKNWMEVLCILKSSNNEEENVLFIINKTNSVQKICFESFDDIFYDHKKILDISYEKRLNNISNYLDYSLNPYETKILYCKKI